MLTGITTEITEVNLKPNRLKRYDQVKITKYPYYGGVVGIISLSFAFFIAASIFAIIGD
jgi:hypothetical protein